MRQTQSNGIPADRGALSFEDLHRLYRPRILRYLKRLVGEREAEDLTQEVFLKVSRSLPEFEGRCRVSTWIYRIAANAAIDRMRRASFRSAACGGEPESEDAASPPARGHGSAESSLMRKEMNGCLRAAIEELPASHREVVVLGVLGEMKNREIADRLGITLETVKIRLHRGRSSLREKLGKRCGWYRDARNRLTWDGRILQDP